MTTPEYAHRVEVRSNESDGNLSSRGSLADDLGTRIDEVQSLVALLAASLSPAKFATSAAAVSEMRVRVGIDLEATVGAVVVRGTGRAAFEIEITWNLTTPKSG